MTAENPEYKRMREELEEFYVQGHGLPMIYRDLDEEFDGDIYKASMSLPTVCVWGRWACFKYEASLKWRAFRRWLGGCNSD